MYSGEYLYYKFGLMFLAVIFGYLMLPKLRKKIVGDPAVFISWAAVNGIPFLPMLSLLILQKTPLTVEHLLPILTPWIIGLSEVGIAFGYAWYKKYDGPMRSALATLGSAANCGNAGIPAVVLAVSIIFGSAPEKELAEYVRQATALAVIYYTSFCLYMATVGVIISSMDSIEEPEEAVHVQHPPKKQTPMQKVRGMLVIYFSMAGILLNQLGYSLPNPLVGILQPFAEMTTLLMLFGLGLAFRTSLGNVAKLSPVIDSQIQSVVKAIGVLRYIVSPAIAFALVSFSGALTIAFIANIVSSTEAPAVQAATLLVETRDRVKKLIAARGMLWLTAVYPAVFVLMLLLLTYFVPPQSKVVVAAPVKSVQIFDKTD